MDTPELAFRSISIRHMPGFEDEGFALENLEPCINIITGRNASGKTTTARALCLLLWPSEEYHWSSDYVEIAGELVLNDEEWRIEVAQGQANFIRDGIRTDHFPAPAEQTQDRYNLALHELIQTDDDAFAERIIRESAGGYDVETAAESLGYHSGIKTRNVGEYQAYRKSRESLRETRREQEQLKDEERRLKDLKRRRNQAQDARRRAELLELAVAYKDAEKELAAREAALAKYPEGIENASGKEYDRLQSINEEIDEAERRKEAAQKKMTSARRTIESLVIPDDGLDEGVLETLSEQVEIIDKLEQRRSRCKEELKGYRSEAQQILRELDPELSIDEWLAVDLEGVSDLDRLARRSERVRGEREALETMRKWLGTPEQEDDIEKLRAGLGTLRAWLREAGTADSSRVSFRIAAAAVLTTLLAGILAYLFGSIGWLALLVPAGILVYGLKISSSTGASVSDIRRKDYRQTDLEQPEAWAVGPVEALLDRLHDRYAKAKVEEERLRRWRRLEEQQEALEREEERLERARTVVEDRVGPVPFVEGDIPLIYFLRKVQLFQQKQEKISGLEGQIQGLDDQMGDALDMINNRLRSFDHSKVETTGEAKETVRAIARAHDQWRESSRELSDAREVIEASSEAIARKSSERTEIYEELCLEQGDLDGLKELMQWVESFEEEEKKEYNARNRWRETREALREHELYAPDLEESARVDLQEELESCRVEAEKFDAINKEIIEIEKLVERLQNQHDLEVALAERDQCLEALKQLREDNLQSLAGHTLAEYIKKKTRYQSRPAVFEKADRLFSRITGGRYQLVLGGSDAASFKARDVREDRTYDLEELSSGTKIQLLLSVRIAFVESQEQIVKFPLFVDEVLANSDDVRARAIIDALVEICEDGRQIFYFTAQSDEVDKWRRILEPRQISYSVRSLSDAASVATVGGLRSNNLSLDLVHSVVRPDGHSHDSYREELNVPEFHPLVDPIEKLHLWYFVEDTALLHECLVKGIDAWGPLKTYLDSGGRIAGHSREELQTVCQKAEILEEVLALYRRGRARPVPPRELQRTDAVTENFVEEVTELLHEVKADPEQLIQGLRDRRVSRFRADKIDELETYLEEHGYIDPDETLPPSELKARIQAITSHYAEVEMEAIERLLDRVL